MPKIGANQPNKGSKENIAKHLEIVRLKELATHELSVVSNSFFFIVTYDF